jgi:hypothetical protein
MSNPDLPDVFDACPKLFRALGQSQRHLCTWRRSRANLRGDHDTAVVPHCVPNDPVDKAVPLELSCIDMIDTKFDDMLQQVSSL